jgi:hypothetical protein
VLSRAGSRTNQAALRQLGNRLVGILHGCLKTRTNDEDAAWAYRQKDLPSAARQANRVGCLRSPSAVGDVWVGARLATKSDGHQRIKAERSERPQRSQCARSGTQAVLRAGLGLRSSLVQAWQLTVTHHVRSSLCYLDSVKPQFRASPYGEYRYATVATVGIIAGLLTINFHGEAL